MAKKSLPQICPSCGGTLQVHIMQCPECNTHIEGDYPLPALMRLKEEDMRFVYDFVMCSGSLKALAQKMDLSYPSVRNRLDDIIAKMESMTNESDK